MAAQKPFTQPTVGLGESTKLPEGAGLSGEFNNPFGLALGHSHNKGTGVFGGPRDLLKSVATLGMGRNLLNQQAQQPDMPAGLQSSLEGYAAKNPYLSSMLTNYLPSVQNQSLMQGEQYRTQLRDLMQNSYILGGGLYGGQLSAVAAAKQIQKGKDAQKKALIQSIVGGAMQGLGMDKFGEKDTTQGLIGVL